MTKSKQGIAPILALLLLPLVLSFLSPSIFGVIVGFISRSGEAVSAAISENIAYILAVNYIIVFCVALLLMKKQGVSFADIGISKKSFNLKHIFLAVIVGVGCFALLNLLPAFLGINGQTASAGDAGSFIFFISSITLAPVVEEFIFRSYGVSMLKDKLPVWASLLIPSACFSLIHLYMGIANLIVAFIMGTALSVFFLRTKNGIACMAAHFCANFSIGVMYAVSASQ
jgi:membrane protease YdiL (CAAX protease family)